MLLLMNTFIKSTWCQLKQGFCKLKLAEF